jgi:UDP-N-acetylmuramoyl-tripeptide--D-alanyl-D-alanine ligase
MLELGEAAGKLHKGLTKAIAANAIDLVFCAGPLMQSLWQALPSERRGGYANSASALEADVVAAIRGGDIVMVKGSAGSKMGPIVKSLAARYSRAAAPDHARAEG